ncbi:hypothetical protein ACFLZX_04200 [Nanoarchaeota archaeon]
MNIGKISVRPTKHYLLCHSDIEGDLIVITILSPTKTLCDKRYGKNRFTYIKQFKKFIVKVHTKKDESEGKIWVINAFKDEMSTM